MEAGETVELVIPLRQLPLRFGELVVESHQLVELPRLLVPAAGVCGTCLDDLHLSFRT